MKKLFSTRVSDTAFNFAMLVLRLGFGLLMLTNHGYSKLVNYAGMLKSFQDPTGIFTNPVALGLTVFAEFFCAAFIVLGLFTRLACIPLIITMSIAFFKVHGGRYAPGPGSGEMALLFLTGFVVLLFTGPGRISLDRFIGK